MKDSKLLFKKLGFASISLCAACCLLPIVGAMLGVGSLSLISGFLEWAGVISIAAAILFFVVFLFRNRKVHTCDVNCTCKERQA